MLSPHNILSASHSFWLRYFSAWRQYPYWISLQWTCTVPSWSPGRKSTDSCNSWLYSTLLKNCLLVFILNILPTIFIWCLQGLTFGDIMSKWSLFTCYRLLMSLSIFILSPLSHLSSRLKSPSLPSRSIWKLLLEYYHSSQFFFPICQFTFSDEVVRTFIFNLLFGCFWALSNYFCKPI